MMRLSTKGRYATRLMLELAINYGNGNMLLKDIAKKQGISEGYLEHLIPPLKSAGLVHASRGSRGGYILAKSPAEITVKDIVILMEGSLSPTECVDDYDICANTDICVTQEVWKELGEKISQTLEAVTLKDLVERHKQKKEDHHLYHI